MQSTPVFKTFWHCIEDSQHALLHGRTEPLEFKKCVAPAIMFGKTKRFSRCEISTHSNIQIGQMKSKDAIPCSSGISPCMLVPYQSYETYNFRDFQSVEFWHEYHGIYAYTRESKAWRSY